MLHGDLLGERAKLTPEREALVFVPTGERLTYGELDAKATAVAVALVEGLGLAKGDRIGLLAHNSIEFLDVFFAAAKSGIVVVPLSTRATAHELEPIVCDSGMRALAFGPELGSLAGELDEQCDLESLVALDQAPLERSISLSSLVERAHGSPRVFEPCAPDDLYALLYTSGTTGKPKGVMIPHRMVAWNGYNTTVCWDLHADDRSPIFTPLYHAGGLGAFLMPIIAAGGTIVLHRGFDSEEVWKTIESEKCTVVLGVPSIWKMLLESPLFPTVDLSSIRWLISGGAPLPVWIIEAYQKRGVVFKQGFGMTEVGVNCFSMTVEDSFVKQGSIGRPMLYTAARLVGEDGAEVPVGEVGELHLRGPHVSAGYWQNPEATAAAYLEDGWFRTGDSARRDADNFFYIAGRKKEMFISGGVNIYPAELEAELLQHPHVRDAAVIGVEDERWGEVGVAFVVRATEDVDESALVAFLEGRLSRYKVPKRWIFVDALPRTPYGKVEKGKLGEMLG